MYEQPGVINVTVTAKQDEAAASGPTARSRLYLP